MGLIPNKNMNVELNSKIIESIREKAKNSSSYKILDVSFNINSDSSEIIEQFDQIFKRFRVKEKKSRESSFYVINNSEILGKPFILRGERINFLLNSGHTANHAYMIVIDRVVNRINDYFLVHGGALSFNNEGFIIIAPPGFGKTTLVLKLLEYGFKFLSDDFAPINRKTGFLVPMPRSIGIRDGTLKFFKDISLKEKKPFVSLCKGNKWIFDIDEIKDGLVGKPCKVKYVVILDAGAEAQQNNKGNGTHLLNIALWDDKGFVDDISRIEEVEIISRDYTGDYCLVKLKINNVKNMKIIFDKYKDEIIFIDQVEKRLPDFNGEVKFLPISKTEASLELLRNLRNRSRESLIYKEFEGKFPAILAEVSGIIKDAKCFKMTPGAPDEMAKKILQDGYYYSKNTGRNDYLLQ